MSTATNRSIEERVRSCPVCKAPPRHWATKRHGNDTYSIDRCPKCGYAFVNPRPSMSFLKAHYRTSGHGASAAPLSVASVVAAEEADPNSTIDAKRMISTIKNLTLGRKNTSGRLLDVGAGYGFFSKEAITNNFQVIAIDLADTERQISRSVSGIDPIPISFEDLELDQSSLSVVLMSQVLEHALDVEVWVSKAWQLLESDGILAIALPNFGSLQRLLLQEKEPYICPPDHLNFFTPGSLTGLMERQGFVVEAVQHVSRVPRGTIKRRMPGILSPLAHPLWIIAANALKIVDFMRLGSIINVYGRKVSAFRRS